MANVKNAAPMSKADYIAMVTALYRALNLADSDSADRPVWATPEMAGPAGCKHLDALIRGTFSAEEANEFYANF
jgi:hypothetical protein